jgi:Fe-S cluster biogenesis protein NfuA
MFGFRKAVKSVVKSVLGMENNSVQTTQWEQPDLSKVTQEPAPSSVNGVNGNDDDVQSTSTLNDNETSIGDSDPTEDASAKEVGVEVSTSASAVPVAEDGMELNIENVEEIIDEYIRPGVAADGGDIQLLKIEDNDVYVKLTGACQSCSSAIMTMKMGVEALLREEFPSMRELIDETEYAA